MGAMRQHRAHHSAAARAGVYAAYLVGATGALLLLLEGAGRLYIHLRHGRPGKTYGLWIADPELGATHRPNGYNTHTSLNDWGFRNREDVFEPKPPGSLRVIAFGGSTTFGYNLKDGETYTGRLEALLRARGYPRSQVLNAGRITYSAAQNAILARRLVPKLKPDYALLYEGVNELLNAWMLQKDGVSLDSLGERHGVIGRSYDYNRWLLRNSLLVRFVDYVVKARLAGGTAPAERAGTRRGEAPEAARNAGRPSPEPEEPVHPWLVRNYDRLLREQLGFLRRQGTTPVVFRYPSVGSTSQRFFSDLSARVAAEEGAAVCDLESRFEAFGARKRDLFIETGVHVAPEGAQVLAWEVGRLILELEGRRATRDPLPSHRTDAWAAGSP